MNWSTRRRSSRPSLTSWTRPSPRCLDTKLFSRLSSCFPHTATVCHHLSTSYAIYSTSWSAPCPPYDAGWQVHQAARLLCIFQFKQTSCSQHHTIPSTPLEKPHPHFNTTLVHLPPPSFFFLKMRLKTYPLFTLIETSSKPSSLSHSSCRWYISKKKPQ